MIEEIAPVAYAATVAAAHVPLAWEHLGQHAQEAIAADVEAVLLGQTPGWLSEDWDARCERVFVAVVKAMSAAHPIGA